MTGTSGCLALTMAMALLAYGLANSENWSGERWWAHDSKNWMTCAPSSIWWHAYSPMLVARWSQKACMTSGSWLIIFLVSKQCLFAMPLTEYAASVNGAPTKPRSEVRPSVSLRRLRSVSPTKGSCAPGSSRCVSLAMSAAQRGGLLITGPLPLITSKSMPIAGSGVRMSENMITPSMPYAFQHCSESSVAISGVSERTRNG
mmetsp:Transcript_24068/g.49789  ORF Transcript_24068/g.49789 Transcript_24068/m.49789 type:complete len:202 (+) Transcript_24068:367-972(+)